MPSASQMIVWIVVGLIGGGLASRLITWDREGFGSFRNLGLGLVGALIGGLLFRVFNLFPGLDKVSVSLRDSSGRRIAHRACGDLADPALPRVSIARHELDDSILPGRIAAGCSVAPTVDEGT